MTEVPKSSRSILLQVILITGILLFFLMSFLAARRLRLDESIKSIIPDNDPVVKNYFDVLDRFQTLDRVFIDVGSDTADKVDIIKFADNLYARLCETKLFSDVHYKVSGESMGEAFAHLTESIPCLLSKSDLQELQNQLSKESVSARLNEARRSLLEPSGAFMKEMIRRDPLGLTDVLGTKLKALNDAGGGAHIIDGRIWSVNQHHILIVAIPIFPASETVKTDRLLSTLRRVRDEVVRDFPDASVTISYASGHISMYDNTNAIKSDVNWSVSVSTIAIAILGCLFFRRKIYVAIAFLPTVFGLAAAAMLFGLIYPNISGMAIGCGSALIGITVDYGIYVLFKLDNMRPEDFHTRSIIKEMFMPLLLCCLTTIAAFACLLLSDLPGQKQIGMFGIVGEFGAMLFAMLLLPYISPKPKVSIKNKVSTITKVYRYILIWRDRHARIIYIGSSIIVVISIYGITQLNIGADMTKLTYLTPDNRVDEENVLNTWGRFAPTFIVCKGSTTEEALQENDKIYHILDQLQQEGNITTISSIAPIIPSKKTQSNNLSYWQEFWSERQTKTVLEKVKRTGIELGFTEDAFDPFFLRINETPASITLEQFENTNIQDLVDTYISVGKNDVMVLTRISIADGHTFEDVSSRIHSAAPNTIIVDRQHFAQYLSMLIVRSFGKLSFVAGLAVFLCLWVMLWRTELVVICFIPAIFSVVVTLGVLGIFGIPINMINTMFIIIILGVGVDYGVYLLTSSVEEHFGQTDHDAQMIAVGTVVLCALTTLCGFGALLLASHPIFFSIGITGFLSITTSLLGALVFVPGLARCLWPHDGYYGLPSTRTILCGFYVYGYLAVFFVFYAIIGHPLLHIWYGSNVKKREDTVRNLSRFVAWLLIKTVPLRGSEFRFLDATPEVLAKPGIIVANHQSNADVLLVFSLPKDSVMMVKNWVWRAPGLGRVIRDSGHLLVDNVEPDKLLANCRKVLDKGISIIVFPEGTRSKDGRMHRFHLGAFELAVRTGADIIPVLLTDTWACIPRHAFWIGHHQSVIRVMPRITNQNFDYGQGSRMLARHVKMLMEAQVKTDWHNSQSGKAFWKNIQELYSFQGTGIEWHIKCQMRWDSLCEEIDALIPDSETVLDVKCGYGLFCNILASKSLDRTLIAIDSDVNKIRVAKQTVRARLNVKFKCADAARESLPEAYAVLLIDALHHWSREGQLCLINNIYQCLCPGGILVFRPLKDNHEYSQTSIFTENGLILEKTLKRLCSLHPCDYATGSQVVYVFRKPSV